MKPSIFTVILLLSCLAGYAQSEEGISKDPLQKKEQEQTFKYYPEKTLDEIFKNKSKPLELAKAQKDRETHWPMPVVKPSQDFRSEMQCIKPDSSVRYTMRIVKP